MKNIGYFAVMIFCIIFTPICIGIIYQSIYDIIHNVYMENNSNFIFWKSNILDISISIFMILGIIFFMSNMILNIIN